MRTPMNPLRAIALLLLLVLAHLHAEEFPPSPVAAPAPPSGEDPAAEGANTPQRQDPDTGADVPSTPAATQGTMTATAEQIEAARGQYDLPDNPEALLPKVLNENLENL